MTGGCFAALTLDRAPHLHVGCNRPPGHDGLHQATITLPLDVGAAPVSWSDARQYAAVWLQWEQAAR